MLIRFGEEGIVGDIEAFEWVEHKRISANKDSGVDAMP